MAGVEVIEGDEIQMGNSRTVSQVIPVTGSRPLTPSQPIRAALLQAPPGWAIYSTDFIGLRQVNVFPL